METEVSVFVPAQVWTLNEERRWVWQRRHRETEALREAAGWTFKAKKLGPVVEPVVITVIPQLRRRNQDAAACVTAAKPIIDALVDQKVLSGDGPKVVLEVRFRRANPVGPTGLEGVLLLIRSVPSSDLPAASSSTTKPSSDAPEASCMS